MKKISSASLLFCISIYTVQSQPGNSIKANSDSISWESPDDGGTPRDLSRVTKTAPYEYHIQASFEEGGESVLKHAVSRMDIICNNHGSAPLKLTVRIDLSGDGKRTDYDNKPEAGMKLRDFIFIRSLNQPWQQVNGQTDGWTSIIQFEAQPGITQIGLSPWYTYSDYRSFIDSLPEGTFLTRKMIVYFC